MFKLKTHLLHLQNMIFSSHFVTFRNIFITFSFHVFRFLYLNTPLVFNISYDYINKVCVYMYVCMFVCVSRFHQIEPMDVKRFAGQARPCQVVWRVIEIYLLINKRLSNYFDTKLHFLLMNVMFNFFFFFLYFYFIMIS